MIDLPLTITCALIGAAYVGWKGWANWRGAFSRRVTKGLKGALTGAGMGGVCGAVIGLCLSVFSWLTGAGLSALFGV